MRTRTAQPADEYDGDGRLTQTEAFIAQVVGTVIALLIVLVPILWRLRGPIERIVKRLEAQSSQTVEVATAAASQIGEVSRLIALSQQQLALQQTQQQYMIAANTSLREDRDEQKRRLDNVQAQFNDVNARLGTYSDNLGNLTTALENSETAKAELDRRVGELTQKIDILTSASIDNTRALAAAQSELELTRRELEKTKVSLTSAVKRIGDLESQRDAERQTAASEKQALETELQAEREKVASLQTQVNDLQKQVKDLQSQLDAQKPSPVGDPDDTQKITGLFTTPVPGGAQS